MVTLGWPLPGPLFSFGILGPPRCEGFDDDDVVAPNVKLSPDRGAGLTLGTSRYQTIFRVRKSN